MDTSTDYADYAGITPEERDYADDADSGGRRVGKAIWYSRGSCPETIRIINNVSVATTKGIRVEVVSRYLPERSSPRQNQFLFAYHITISNEGDEVAQLESRSWIITDGNGEVERVEGPGVVGEQPLLEPGMKFEYTSFCPLTTPFGTMEGHYVMIRAGGESFEAEIPPFMLAVPNAVN